MRGFRVWCKSIGEYIDFGMMISQDGKLLYMDLGHEFQEVPSEDCIDYIVEYPTGLKDKNGKEIYEGDIVQMSLELAIRQVGFVCFTDGRFLVKDYEWEDGSYHIVDFYDYNIPNKDFEVIGNIHENPELLEAA